MSPEHERRDGIESIPATGSASVPGSLPDPTEPETGNADARRPSPTSIEQSDPPGRAVQLALTDGFEGDTVLVRLDGREVARQAGVKTSLLLGLAADLTIDIPDRVATIEVQLLERGITANVRVDKDVVAVTSAVEGDRLTIAPHTRSIGFA